MSKGNCYDYSGSKEDVVRIANSLPQTGEELLERGWKDISHPQQAANHSRDYKEPQTGLRVRYDEPVPGAPGFKGKAHYHIYNPDSLSNRDLYLDKNGNPVSNKSNSSHILPRKEDSK